MLISLSYLLINYDRFYCTSTCISCIYNFCMTSWSCAYCWDGDCCVAKLEMLQEK